MGFPDESNTGVPPGVTLRPSGSITIDTAGAVVSGLDITGGVVITAPNVTLVNCRVAATGFVGVYVTAPGAVIENCEIISVYSKGTKGIWFDSATGGGVVRGCDIHDVEDGVYISTTNIVVEDNYIHDLKAPTADPHYDGIQLDGGGSGATIRHNSVLVDQPNMNSAITTGSVQNVTIDNNWLDGGAYTLRLDGANGGTITGVRITNNTFGDHVFGYWTFVNATPFVSGNVDDVTGILLPNQNTSGAAIAGLVAINDVTISEGDSGTNVAIFTVTRSGGTAAFDVNFATSDGTATVSDSDYVAASNTLHFGANQNTQTISVTIKGDTKVEANETFNVALSNATNGAIISDSKGVGTITNNDGAAIAGSVSINDVTIIEGTGGTKVATFTVTRSGGTAAFDVNFATSNATATVADSDYVAAANTLNFGANQNTQTISVTINGDTKVEGNETFNVILSNATNGATISDSQGVGTINNDDGAVIPGPVSIFSTEGYLSANADVRALGIDPRGHFDQLGWKEGRDPSPGFDIEQYREHNPDVAAAGINPLLHYELFGRDEGRQTFAAVGKTIDHGFDAEFYLLTNPDVGFAGADPFQHYALFGFKEGRDPNAFFDSSGYLAAYADVAAAGVNPLEHYMAFGFKEGRDPSGAFDTRAYLAANPDVAAAGVNPLEHFLQFGIHEGRLPLGDGLFA